MATTSGTSQATYAMFTREEMDRRYARARELMAKQGIDLLLITNEENFQYFAGTTGSLGLHYSNTRPAIFILPKNRDPIAITGQVISHSMGLNTYLKDLRGYTDILSFPHQIIVEAIGDAGPDIKRVGVELGQEQRMGMPVGTYLKLVEALPQIEFTDAADIIIYLRMVKSPEEVAYMKQAADITGRARQRLFDQIMPGMTERDVVRALRRLILEEGGDRTSFVHLISDIPACHTQAHLDRPLKKGNTLYVDAGAYVKTYTIDFPRLATLGKATDEQKRQHRVLLDVNKKMADALRPGITCSELYKIGAQAIEAAGFEIVPVGRMGHGQGLLLTEPPSICPDDDTPMEPGMVISTEPEITMSLLWEDVHVITEDGHEQLTLETDELREIPFD